MPHRLVSSAILILWLVAAVALFRKDILPQMIVGPPPDLRTLVQAEDEAQPVRWAILLGDPSRPELYRPIGKIKSESSRRRDGSVQWRSEAVFDASEFAAGNGRLALPGFGDDGPRPKPADGWSTSEMVEVTSVVEIDPVGDLFYLRAAVRSQGEAEDLLSLEGHVEKNALIVTTNSPLPLLRATRYLPYRSRGMVENPLAPIDRMPGLRIGQRWESQMANPLTGGAQGVHCEVVEQQTIHWGGGLVKALVVATRTKFPPLTFRTWVRPGDGLVLRQEIPYPLAPLVLERLVPEKGRPRGPTP